MARKQKHRRISISTILAVILALAVLSVGGMVLSKLKGSQTLNLNEAIEALQISDFSGLTVQEIQETVRPAATQVTGVVEWSEPAATAVRAEATAVPVTETLTLTLGGSVRVVKAIRQASYFSSSKKYDFSETLQLLARSVQADYFALSMENLLMSGVTPNNNVTVPEVAEMFRTAGVDAILLGYPTVYDQGLTGIEQTSAVLQEAGITMLGAAAQQTDVQPKIITIKDISFCILHYTESLSSTGKKKLSSEKASWSIPIADADTIAADITAARQAGAEIVIVSMNWGTDDKTSPTTAQKKLAQSIADAGADVIVGTGTQVVQPVVWLQGKDANGAAKDVLCAYSLGDVLNAGRENNHVCAALLNLSFSRSGQSVSLTSASLTPTYIWRYQQDGIYYYRPVASNELPTDGMDTTQISAMTNALKRTMKLAGIDNLILK